MTFALQVVNQASVPIAKELDTSHIIYLTPEDQPLETITRRGMDGQQYQCNNCRKWFNSRQGYTYHIKMVCMVEQKNCYELTTEHELNPLPTIKRQVIYLGGSQDSGKSYRCACYINLWLKLFPERPVIMISRHDHDETFALPEFGQGIEQRIIRMKPNYSWVVDKFQLSDFENSLVIFDDVVSSNWSDNPEPKEAKKESAMIQDYIELLIKDMCCNGRHENIHMMITNHDLYDRGHTAKILCNCTDMVIFPGTTGEQSLNYFCKTYVGLVKAKIEQVKSLKSRWIWIHKNAPKYFMYSHGVVRYDLFGLGHVGRQKKVITEGASGSGNQGSPNLNLML